jgi:hypothetical protein
VYRLVMASENLTDQVLDTCAMLVAVKKKHTISPEINLFIGLDLELTTGNSLLL